MSVADLGASRAHHHPPRSWRGDASASAGRLRSSSSPGSPFGGACAAPRSARSERLRRVGSYAGMSGARPVGADKLGRDLLSRLMWGGRTSLLGPLIAIGLSDAHGFPRDRPRLARREDRSLVVAVLDVLFAFPALLLAALTVALFGGRAGAVAIAVGIAYLPWARAPFAARRCASAPKPYVTALEVQGAPASRSAVATSSAERRGARRGSSHRGLRVCARRHRQPLVPRLRRSTADRGLGRMVSSYDDLLGAPGQAVVAGGVIVAWSWRRRPSARVAERTGLRR